MAEQYPGGANTIPLLILAIEPLPTDDLQAAALREAIASLSGPARQELYALMRIGQGHLAAKKWYRGLSEAGALGPGVITAAIIEDADRHDHLAKGLYEEFFPMTVRPPLEREVTSGARFL